MPINNRKFGVELEGYGLTEDEIIDLLKAEFECSITDNTHGYTQVNGWTVKNDGSVLDDSGINSEYCFEVTSPPLVGVSGLEEIKGAVNLLRNNGAKVNDTCGMHVHVDATGLKAIDLANIVIQYNRLEQVIDCYMPVNRRNNNFCSSLREESANMLHRISQIASCSDIRNFVYDFFSNRYRKVNLYSYIPHGTVEFRQHSGSFNKEKITNWIQFCVNFVEQCKVPEESIDIVSINEESQPGIEKVARRANSISSTAQNVVDILNSSIGTPVSIENLATVCGSRSLVEVISEIRRAWNLTTTQLPHRGETYFLRNTKLVVQEETGRQVRSVCLTRPETPLLGLPNEIISFYQERASEFSGV